MTKVSEEDKLNLAKFLESSTVTVAMLNTLEPLVEDDGLRKIIETSINTGEAQIKSVQEFCISHGLT